MSKWDKFWRGEAVTVSTRAVCGIFAGIAVVVLGVFLLCGR